MTTAPFDALLVIIISWTIPDAMPVISAIKTVPILRSVLSKISMRFVEIATSGWSLEDIMRDPCGAVQRVMTPLS